MVVVLWIIFFTAMTAFFSAVEIAIFTLPESKLRLMLLHKGARGRQAHRLHELRKKPQRLLAALVICNNALSMASASLMTAASLQWFGFFGVGVAIVVMTIITSVFGELLPKTIGQQHAAGVARITSRLTQAVVFLLTPLAVIFEWLAKMTNRLLGGSSQLGVSEEEVRAMVHMGTEAGNVAVYEREMIENIFSLDDIVAEKIMTEVSDMTTLDLREPTPKLIKQMVDTGYTRYPAHMGDINDIVGIIYSKDLSQALTRHRTVDAIKFKELLQPAKFIPEQKPLDALLRDFKRDRRHVAIVVDEFGETRGLVTLEDILEEIVGDIEDEQDQHQPNVRRVNARTVVATADATVAEIHRVLHVKVYNDMHRNIAWVILNELERVPKTGEELVLNGVKVIVEQADERKIQQVKLIKLP